MFNDSSVIECVDSGQKWIGLSCLQARRRASRAAVKMNTVMWCLLPHYGVSTIHKSQHRALQSQQFCSNFRKILSEHFVEHISCGFLYFTGGGDGVVYCNAMASSNIISLKTPRLSTGGISGTHFSHGPGEIFKRFVSHIRQTAFWRYFQAALLAWHHTKHNRVHKTFALCVFFFVGAGDYELLGSRAHALAERGLWAQLAHVQDITL